MTTPSMNDEAQKLMNEQTDKVSCRADFQWLQTKKMFFWYVKLWFFWYVKLCIFGPGNL